MNAYQPTPELAAQNCYEKDLGNEQGWFLAYCVRDGTFFGLHPDNYRSKTFSNRAEYIAPIGTIRPNGRVRVRRNYLARRLVALKLAGA